MPLVFDNLIPPTETWERFRGAQPMHCAFRRWLVLRGVVLSGSTQLVWSPALSSLRLLSRGISQIQAGLHYICCGWLMLKLIYKPVVQRTMVLEFQGTDGMRDSTRWRTLFACELQGISHKCTMLSPYGDDHVQYPGPLANPAY